MEKYQPSPETVNFCHTYLKPIFQPLFEGNYYFPAIQDMYKEDEETVKRVFGCGLTRCLVCEDFPQPGAEKARPFASLFKDKPILIFRLPHIRAVMENLIAYCPHNFYDMFRNVCIIGVMHEMDHLVLKSSDESIVWARTCQRSIKTLVGLNQDISPSCQKVYEKWIKRGEKESDPLWKSFIARLYEQ